MLSKLLYDDMAGYVLCDFLSVTSSKLHRNSRKCLYPCFQMKALEFRKSSSLYLPEVCEDLWVHYKEGKSF